MQRFKSKIVGSLLILSVMMPAYTLIVQAVQQFNERSLIDQLSLFDAKNHIENRTQFHAGEILTLSAKVAAGDVYFVTIYDKNGSVFSQNSRIVDSKAMIQVPLNPPSFHAGKSYMVVFRASICCYPIPGAFAYDEKIAGFSICLSETKLSLACDYNGAFHKLSLGACVVNSEGVPVANKTVKFGLQLNTSSYIQDRGWLPIGSAETDADGSAGFMMGCNLFSGTHYLKAEFEGDSDFGSSKNTTQFTIVPYQPLVQLVSASSLRDGNEFGVKVTDSKGYPLMGKTVVVEGQGVSNSSCAVTDEEGRASVKLGKSELFSGDVPRFVVLGDLFTSQSELSFDGSGWMGSVFGGVSKKLKPVVSQGSGGLRVSMSSDHPYAVLPTQVNAMFTGWIQPGSIVDFSFLLDGARELSRVSVVGRGNSTYCVCLEWCPDVVGAHWISVAVSNGAYRALSVENGVYFDVVPCPSNLQMYAPQGVYGAIAKFSLVFTMPRLYEQSGGMGLFSSFNTAREFVNASGIWKIDQGINSSVIGLYVNGSGPLEATTDEGGVACLNLVIPMGSYSHRRFNFTALVNQPLYEPWVLQRVVSYSLVTVTAGGGASQYLKLDCSVGEGNAAANEVYVGAESSVEATASLFGMPIWNAPVNLTLVKVVPTNLQTPYNKTAISAGYKATYVNITGGANFLRVAYAYSYSNKCLDADVAPYSLKKDQNWYACCDGKVDIKETSLIGANWNKYVSQGANPLADINHDGVVNIQDLSIIGLYWQRSGGYSSGFGAYANFSTPSGYRRVALDSGGCASIPSGAFRVVIQNSSGGTLGAFVEFFRVVDPSDLNKQSTTDTSGIAKYSWTPEEVGEYLVEESVKVNSQSKFSATVSQYETTTSVHESVCAVKYAEVVKRPVNLNLTCENIGYQDDIFPMHLDATADTYVRNDSENSYGGETCLIVGSEYGAEWTRSYLRFDIPFLPPDAFINSAKLYLMNATPVSYLSDRKLGVFRVTQPWNEYSLNRYYMPSFDPDAVTFIFPDDAFPLTLDVKDLVEQWVTGAVPNYGLVIKDFVEEDRPGGSPPIQFTFNSRESAYNQPQLQIWYNRPVFRVTATVTDPVLGDVPIRGLDVKFPDGSIVQTNPDGMAFYDIYPSYDFPAGIISVDVESLGTNVLCAANATIDWDSRWETQLECTNYGSGIAKGIGAGVLTRFDFRLTYLGPSLGGPMVGMRVDFCVDEQFVESLFTDGDGRVRFNRGFSAGTHYVDVNFAGDQDYFGFCYRDWWRPCNTTLAVIAMVVPLGIEFSVSPETFPAGSQITLRLGFTTCVTTRFTCLLVMLSSLRLWGTMWLRIHGPVIRPMA